MVVFGGYVEELDRSSVYPFDRDYLHCREVSFQQPIPLTQSGRILLFAKGHPSTIGSKLVIRRALDHLAITESHPEEAIDHTPMH